MEDIEVRIGKLSIGNIKCNRLTLLASRSEVKRRWTRMTRRCISAEEFTHLAVDLFERSDTVSWMGVQGRLESTFMELLEEFDVVGEKLVVPP